MKKTLLLATIFLMLVSTTSCKKLLGLDSESLLSKKPWKGDKMEVITNGTLHSTRNINDWVFEVNKKTHRYKLYINNSVFEEGNWTYDDKMEKLVLEPDNDPPLTFFVSELNKKTLNMEIKTNAEDGSSLIIKHYFYRD